MLQQTPPSGSFSIRGALCIGRPAMKWSVGVGLLTLLFPGVAAVSAQSDDEARFTNHGAPVQIASGRGLWTAQDADGNNLVIARTTSDAPADTGESPRGWMLITNVDTGTTEQVLAPEDVPAGTTYRSFGVSRENKLYTSEYYDFLEYDIDAREWTFHERVDTTILEIEEGPDGTIWIGGVYRPALISYDPQTQRMIDHGRMDDEERYLSHISFDEHGWVYCGIGTARGNLVAYNPETGERRQLVPEDRRRTGTGSFTRREDGQLYGRVSLLDEEHAEDGEHSTVHYLLRDGQATQVDADDLPPEIPTEAGGRPVLADGRIVATHNFERRYMEIYDPDTMDREYIAFDYKASGATIRPQALTVGQDGNVYVNTSRPTYLAKYDPEADELTHFPDSHAQQSLATQGQYVFGGQYTGGALKVFDTTRPWQKHPPQARTWEPTSEGTVARRATDGDFDTYAAVPTGEDHTSEPPKDIGVEWQSPIEFEQVMVVYHSSGYQPTESGHELQAWVDNTWQSVEAEVEVEDDIYWSYRLAEPVTTTRVRVLVTEFASARTAVRMFRVYESYQEGRDPREASEQDLTRPDIELNPYPAVAHSRPNVNRPIVSFAHPDGDHVMIAGMPGYGRAGGGLSIYNLQTGETVKLSHEELVEHLSITGIEALPNGNLICSTTVSATHGGHAVESEAVLFELDWDTKTVQWKGVPVPDVGAVRALKLDEDGLLYCTGEDSLFFVFDTQTREVVHQQNLAEHGDGRSLLRLPDGRLYLIARDAILEMDPATYEVEPVAEAPTSMGRAVLHDDRIYFISGAHLWSYRY